MADKNNTPDQFEDHEDNEMFFEDLMREALSPKIKQFLNDYFGERIYNLKSETYLQIEKTIREDFILAAQIPEVLYLHRTIKDPDEFDEALANFVPSQTFIIWPENKHWFDQDFSDDDDNDDDDDDTFLEDSSPSDLTPEQLMAKEIINIADEIANESRNMAHFMKSGYEIIIKQAQIFLEENALFDLAILSPEGFEELDEEMNLLIETILENLEAIFYGDLHSDEY